MPKWQTIKHMTEEGEPVLVEVIPTEGHKHSSECWCAPELMQSCDECPTGAEGCWKCSGRGLLPFDPWSGQVPIAVHFDEDLD